MKRYMRWFGGGFAVLLILIIVVPYLIPMEQYVKHIENMVSESTGYKTEIGSISISVLPVPSIKINKIRITRPIETAASQLSITEEKTATEKKGSDIDELIADKIHIPLVLDSLLEGNVVVTRLKLENVVADQELLREFINSLISSDTQQVETSEPSSYELHFIDATALKLRFEDGKVLGPYQLSLDLDMETGLNKVTLSREDGTAHFAAIRAADKFNFTLLAKDWDRPLGFPVQLSSLQTQGIYFGSEVTLTTIDMNIFDGKLTGKGQVSWPNYWISSGEFKTTGINLEKALNNMDEKTLSGSLDADCKFYLTSLKANNILKNPSMDCQYKIANGEFFKADLENAASLGSSKDEQSDSTPFDELSGKMNLNNKNLSIKDLNLISKTLQANGAIQVQQYKTLNGRIEVGVKKTASIASVPLKISGTVSEPEFRPTNDAIAGATIGTVLLGPGVGTAIGVKVSSGISKFIGLFKGKKDPSNIEDKAVQKK